MKKVILSSLIAMFLFVGLTSMISADPPYNASQCQTDCATWAPEVYGFETQGECMSACNTCTNNSNSAGSSAVCTCNLIDAVVGLDNLGLNFGQCVTQWIDIYNGGI